MWKDKIEITDFHSHILPGIDDGSDSVNTSLQMLSQMAEQGVDKVVSTSHYYSSKESIKSFVSRRDEALFRLESYIREHDLHMPEIICGAEVRLYPGLWKESDLCALSIGETKYILIEMPYDNWTPWMYNEIYSVASKGYTPIMAHVERYIDFASVKDITEKLLPLDVIVQCNADFIEDRQRRKFVKKLIKNGSLHVLGSDAHNITSRKPCMKQALEYIEKKYGESLIKEFEFYASEILDS